MRTPDLHIRSELLRDCRGAAMVEGAILLPFFIIVFAGVVYMHQVYSAKISNLVQARECAWEHANNGCDEAKAPSACRFTAATHAKLESMKEISEKDKSRFEQGVAEVASNMSSFVDSVLRLGDGTTATASSKTTRPSILGGGKTTTGSRYTVMCNEKKRDAVDVVIAAYCMLGDLPGCD